MSISRFTTALCVLATLAPAAALAQPSTGSGASDSEYCQTLKGRATRYNDIARDPSQPKGVRDFYSARAAIVLLHARQAGCSWSAIAAGTTPTPTTSRPQAQVEAAPATTSRTRTVRARLGRAEAARKRRGATPRPPRVPSRVAAARVGASPTGSGKLDTYCSAVAGLIQEAEDAGDSTAVSDPQGAGEWYELADHMTDTATRNGCRFTSAIRRTA